MFPSGMNLHLHLFVFLSSLVFQSFPIRCDCFYFVKNIFKGANKKSEPPESSEIKISLLGFFCFQRGHISY